MVIRYHARAFCVSHEKGPRMSFWDKLKGELIDIIEWTDDRGDTLVRRFERYNNEIKYGAKLVVREGQAAVFVDRGQIADVFQPGMYELHTKNLPILSTILGWKHGFESPFKAEVYFVSTRRFTDLKWGTKNPLMLRDAEFGPVRIRAFGTYEIKVDDPGALIQEIVGTDSFFTTDEITDQLRNIVVSRFADVLGESGIPILDLAANYDELGAFITDRIDREFDTYGLDLTKLLVENISLPPAVEEALDKRSSMGVIGDLSRYTQYQTAEAIREAAANPSGGAAGTGMGMGMGFAMGSQMAQQMGQGAAASHGAPPPVPGAGGTVYHVAVGSQQTGPFPMETMQQQIAAGSITRDTLVWKQGMSAWTPAGQVFELQSLFSATPPPLPGAATPPPVPPASS
jgi:membrane protease subunit (stomatin/prohibitin family)